jgi:hypothetical protein
MRNSRKSSWFLLFIQKFFNHSSGKKRKYYLMLLIMVECYLMLLLMLQYYLMLLLTLQVSGFTLSSWQVCVEYSYDILKATVELLATWTECQAVCCFNFIYTETVEQMLWF